MMVLVRTEMISQGVKRSITDITRSLNVVRCSGTPVADVACCTAEVGAEAFLAYDIAESYPNHTACFLIRCFCSTNGNIYMGAQLLPPSTNGTTTPATVALTPGLDYYTLHSLIIANNHPVLLVKTRMAMKVVACSGLVLHHRH
jgi:hypothetical protein